MHNLILTNSVDGFSVGHQAKAVLENSSCMEKRQRNTHDALQALLNISQPGSARVFHLIEEFILSKRIYRNQMGAEMRKISINIYHYKGYFYKSLLFTYFCCPLSYCIKALYYISSHDIMYKTAYGLS